MIVVAQVIDEVADGHRLRHRHQLALHQAAGGFLRIGQGAFDDGAVLGIHFRQDRLLVGLVEVLDQLHRIVGVELFGQFRHCRGGQRLDHALAHVVVELGHHLAGHQVGYGGGKVAPLGRFQQLQQVGDVGRVQRFDQLIGAGIVFLLQRFAHGFDKFRLEPVILVELLALAVRGVLGFAGMEIGFRHVSEA